MTKNVFSVWNEKQYFYISKSIRIICDILKAFLGIAAEPNQQYYRFSNGFWQWHISCTYIIIQSVYFFQYTDMFNTVINPASAQQWNIVIR